ncbi:C1 family peptidase [Ancylomarina sp. DW003]|nr:C1 family peptidase [Ancylomarina sp. DW003]MDE5421167.1 C1 family peptidase [Ancylomarina sp. DW003]
MKKKVLRSTLLLFSVAALTFSLPSCDDSETVIKEDAIQENKMISNSGYLALPKAEYNKIPLAETISKTKSYPSSVSLNCPPVRNQGGEGSCVSWGVGYAARSISWQSANGGAYSLDYNIFSPEFIYNQIKVGGCESGSYITDGLNLVEDQGVCLWADMPYTDVSCDLYPNNNQAALAANYKISNYNRLAIDKDTFKDQLAAGKPIVVGGPIYYQFYYMGYGDIQTRTGYYSYGGHCYCVVGYDDSKKAFKVYNSWGTSWGTDGYGWVSYKIMARVWSEAYVINE